MDEKRYYKTKQGVKLRKRDELTRVRKKEMENRKTDTKGNEKNKIE